VTALLRAVAGTYGVAAYGVAQRTREIGVRMARGATPAEVLWMVLGGEAGTAMAGVAAGVLGALATSRLVRALLFGVGATDPVTLLPVAVLLSAAAAAACYVPAWRVRSRIYRYYGSLIAIEREAMRDSSAEERSKLLMELDQIDASLNTLRLPLAYADGFYVLREHVRFVRQRLEGVPERVRAHQ
jgi:hypothetical protein